MLLRKSDIAEKPGLAEEEVPVPELGGEVVVRGLSLSERMDLATAQNSQGFSRIAMMLAVCVLDADREPLFSVEEWEAFGSKSFASAMVLWDKACALSGMEPGAAAKKSNAPKSDSQ